MNPQIRLRDMATAFLECASFLKEFPEWEFERSCCKKCHENERNKIYVRPFQDGVYGQVGNTDWELCIEAIVCCGIYDFVRALPREWWVRKAKELGVYATRNDSRGYIYPDSPSRNTGQSRHASIGRKNKPTTQEEDEYSGLQAWMKNR